MDRSSLSLTRFACCVACCLLSSGCAPRAGAHATRLSPASSDRAEAALAAMRVMPVDGLPPLAPDGPRVPIVRMEDDGTGGRVVLGTIRGRALAFVADEDDRAVHVIDVDRAKDVGRVALGSRPSQLALTRDGTLLVALRDASAVAALEAPADEAAPLLVTTSRFTVASEPMALAVTPDDGAFVVAGGWGHTVESVDRAMGERSFVVDVAAEPRAVMVSADGHTAYVAHDAAGVLTRVDLDQGTASAVKLDRERSFYDPDDCGTFLDDQYTSAARNARHARALVRLPAEPGTHPDWDARGHERIIVPAARVAPGAFDMRSTGYGMDGHPVLFDVDTYDPVRRTLNANLSAGSFAPLDRRGNAPRECLLPSAAVADSARGALFVACMGNDVVLQYDARALDPMPRRFPVGRGPVGMARGASPSSLVVFSQLDRTLTLLSTSTAKADPPKTLALTALARPLDADIGRGRSLFYTTGDKRISRDGRGCASCHLDGRDDGLVWSSPDGPRRTRMLAGRVAEGPYGWRGEHATLEEHVAASIARIGGTVLSAEDARALAAYVRSIAPPPSRAEGDDRVARGRALFQAPETACAGCHDPARGLTDHDLHDVLSKAPGDRFSDFRTPPLLAASGSGPYFHDGRYASLLDVLGHADGRMGNVGSLSDDDRADLVAYLMTL